MICIYLYIVYHHVLAIVSQVVIFLHSHLVFFMCCNLFLCILVSLRPSCKTAACLVHFGWPVAARMLIKSTWFFDETGKAELHLQRSGRDVIRCLICCSICSVIIVEYLGDVSFRDPGWVSPNCRRHPQFMPSLFSKSLRFRRLK